MLGLELQKDQLRFKPCFPLEWPSVSIRYQFGKSAYKITVFQVTENVDSYWKMDNIQGKGDTLQLADDGRDHEADIYVRI
jgi:cellobiose phosphorylase